MENEEIMTAKNWPLLAPDSESIKLVKNSKGFTWEIKCVGNPVNKETIERLKQLNYQMDKEFNF